GSLVLLSTHPRPIGAQSPVPSPTPIQASVGATTLFRGLVNPRGIVFGPDGRLYVAEAGAGGPETPDVGSRGQRYRMGFTARVSRIDLQGNREIVLDQLASFSNGEDELGATDVAFLDGALYVLTATGGYEI